MGFRDLMAYASPDVNNCSEEARFSFLEGGYVQDLELQGKFFYLISAVPNSFDEDECFNCLVDYLVAKYRVSLNKLCDLKI